MRFSIASKPSPIIITVAALLMLSMASATVIERLYGRDCAWGTIYGSWWFMVLWGVLVLSSLTYLFKKRLRQRHGLVLLHLSLTVILLGASVTRLTSVSGHLRLHTGIPVSYFTTDDGTTHNLPFITELDSFSIITSPATGAALDYRACITVHTTSGISSQSISMNNIGHVYGYRMYMSSFDADGRGVILLVSYDPYGTAITYIGFLLFLVGMAWSIFSRRSRLHHLYHTAMRPAVIILFIFPFISHGLPCMAATASGSVVDGSSPGQSLTSVASIPGLTARLSVVVYESVESGALFSAAIAETLYNTLRAETWPAYICLALSLLLCAPRFKHRLTSSSSFAPRLTTHILQRLFPFVLFCFVTLPVLLRWIVTGHAPVSNIPETLLLMSWLSSALSLVASSRRVPVLGLLCPVVASVCMLGSVLSDSISPLSSLPPILRSPLLSVHVVLVMVSYTLLFCIALLSVRCLLHGCSPSSLTRLTALSRLLLYPAVSFLASGIIAGAVWASISWGTYWSWDAKETWALLTFMVYLAPFHIHSLDSDSSPRLYHIYVLMAFLVVLATYFGVSYFLPGMHSYA
ncbi:MAG: cytochrome c biogenesis protein CcsA [Bacteroidales bacterium]|nr:cytochrome c biogenesis protein CcsA [Bacteroidales bacterium]